MNPTRKFGTFLGVFTPSLLTILGLIMYLRFGWVVGNIGLGLTIITVIVASSITFITGLSASAIATNIQVGVGGEYFLVSRSLGIEPGGAIGIPLYLCRTLSVTFYCFGLAEAFLILWPAEWGTVPSYAIQLLAAILIILVTLLSGKSAALTLKAQIPIMILVGLSIVALAIGVLSSEMHSPNWEPTYTTASEGYWYVFAVFFPAVTGFTAGIGLSGDLKDPRKSIPKGTLGAVLAGLGIYLTILVLFSVTGALTAEELADPLAGVATWTKVAFLGSILIYPAVLGAILSSAFGSILGGPRVLQALSMDGLAPKFLSRLSKTGQPTISTWVTGGIALVAVTLGELNAVAQFVSVLFLTLYVAINLSSAIETLVAEPSYRPKIRIPWYLSLLGTAGAIGVMYLITPIGCIIALGLELILFIWLRSRSLEQQWGDVTAGFWHNTIRYGLLKLDKRKLHPRNWRPLIILFVKDIDKRIQLVKLAEAVGQNHGILTIAKLFPTEGETDQPDRLKDVEVEMRNTLEKHGLQAFCEAHRVKTIPRGILEISKAHGLSDLRTNTVVFGWAEERKGQIRQLKTIRGIADIGKNIMLVRIRSAFPKICKSIDLWWGGKENNGDLMLLLAYLLQLNTQWKEARITIRSVVKTKEDRVRMEDGIIKLLPIARIQASVEVIVTDEDFQTVLHKKSKDADIVFLGIPQPAEGREEESAAWVERISGGLKVTAFVQNNGKLTTVPSILKL